MDQRWRTFFDIVKMRGKILGKVVQGEEKIMWKTTKQLMHKWFKKEGKELKF